VFVSVCRHPLNKEQQHFLIAACIFTIQNSSTDLRICDFRSSYSYWCCFIIKLEKSEEEEEEDRRLRRIRRRRLPYKGLIRW
jgi:hypothetical protein